MSSPEAPSVEVLRRAAALMRERAAMATPGPWRDSSVDGNRYAALVADAPHPDRMKGGGWQFDEGYGGCLVGESLLSADRRHIASWHPVVAVAVADWLDREAALHVVLTAAGDLLRAAGRDLDAGEIRLEIATDPDGLAASTLPQALAVARAYLGEDQS